MAKFDVEVTRMVALQLLVEADTEEEAIRIAKEQTEGLTDLNTWTEYPSERGYYAHELNPTEE